MGVRIVPQGSKQVVQRLGKYHKTLGPGLNIIFPYIDRVANKVTTKDIVLDIPSQEVITKDNAVIIANAVAYINIISPEKSVYGVEDYRLVIQNRYKPPCVQLSAKWTWTTPFHPGTKSRHDAQAKVVLAEASQRAIQKVTDAKPENQNQKDLVAYFEGQKELTDKILQIFLEERNSENPNLPLIRKYFKKANQNLKPIFNI